MEGEPTPSAPPAYDEAVVVPSYPAPDAPVAQESSSSSSATTSERSAQARAQR